MCGNGGVRLGARPSAWLNDLLKQTFVKADDLPRTLPSKEGVCRWQTLLSKTGLCKALL
jgi:hypothetical protein